MPDHLVFVRHGESEGNFVRSAYKEGDESFLTPEFRDRPGHEWRLTPTGEGQAHAAGLWIQEHIIGQYGLPGFDRYMYSPHRRTRETAAHLQLPNADWRLNRQLREREWGELSGLVEEEHKAEYPRNYGWMKADPLHWAPPGGESVSQVADYRIRGVLDTIARDHDEKGMESFLLSTHGELIWAARLVLDYMFNETYMAAEHDQSQKINNCQVVHWTRLDPETGDRAPYLRWSRSVWPWKNPDETGEWRISSRQTLTNEELLAQVETLPRLFARLRPPELAAKPDDPELAFTGGVGVSKADLRTFAAVADYSPGLVTGAWNRLAALCAHPENPSRYDDGGQAHLNVRLQPLGAEKGDYGTPALIELTGIVQMLQEVDAYFVTHPKHYSYDYAYLLGPGFGRRKLNFLRQYTEAALAQLQEGNDASL